jgi:PAX-interacting protein 1
MPSQKSAEQYEKMKGFKVMLERTLHFLQVNKSSIQACFREKIPIYERQILSIISSQRRKPSGGPASSSNFSQQHQDSQGLQQHDSHTNQKPQASLPSMYTGVQTSVSGPSLFIHCHCTCLGIHVVIANFMDYHY